eukprot:CAMPEP_0172489404 /NCGR_PEP_ID=MMETSP1066-20121228/19356_1 /TAXON_ID=671091 /ORGANISM="Coscinodiscus wailesii, Strain CCMP2513" /LENGTH=197 /DNA_ID=CAMNT_0013257219 /DNA_START=96 /DNA_END=689 /DNA_ORIENTATION=+
MVKLGLIFSAFLASTAHGFTAAPLTSRQNSILTRTSASTLTPEVDDIGNNLAVKSLLETVESSGLLSQVARSGLLSKAQEAGISLSKVEELLELAADNPEILVLVEASGPDVLPILPKLVELAPPALPLLAQAITIKPGALQAGAVVSLAAAAGAIYVIPDDTVVSVALQTLIAGALGVAAPAAFVIGSVILGKLTK